MEHSRRHRITADEYCRMGERNSFDPGTRTELIEGVIIDMPPLGNPHMAAVDRLNYILVKVLGDRAIVRGQGCVRLSDYSVPQPDITLLKPREDFYRARAATAEDVLLVIEVSDSTLRFDLEEKIPLYAAHGIQEAWVLDVKGKRANFFRSLHANKYQDISTTAAPGITPIVALAGVMVDLAFLTQF